MASGSLAASVALFAMRKKVEFWWLFLVLGLAMQALVFCIDGPPRTVLDLSLVLLLIAPSTLMGIWVGAKAT
jgi:hypothetical protein